MLALDKSSVLLLPRCRVHPARQVIPGAENFSDKTLLNIVRFSIIPVTLVACIVATTYNKTGYLLIVAFDIVLAGCIAPLFAAIYFKKTVSYLTPRRRRRAEPILICASNEPNCPSYPCSSGADPSHLAPERITWGFDEYGSILILV